jgi:hypothetical protein
MTTEWTPITDKRPGDDDTYYLVRGPQHDTDIAYWNHHTQQWELHDTYEFSTIPVDSGEITHWQPRPEPPVGE